MNSHRMHKDSSCVAHVPEILKFCNFFESKEEHFLTGGNVNPTTLKFFHVALVSACSGL